MVGQISSPFNDPFNYPFNLLVLYKLNLFAYKYQHPMILSLKIFCETFVFSVKISPFSFCYFLPLSLLNLVYTLHFLLKSCNMASERTPTTLPVNISMVVRQNPPITVEQVSQPLERVVVLNQAVFATARIFIEGYQFEAVLDKIGDVWVQKVESRCQMIVPVGGRRITVNPLGFDLPSDWLNTICGIVHQKSINTISPHVPYAIGVLAVYENAEPKDVKWSLVPAYLRVSPRNAALTLKPVNAWMVFRGKAHGISQPLF
jgi:hypothetical protein